MTPTCEAPKLLLSDATETYLALISTEVLTALILISAFQTRTYYHIYGICESVMSLKHNGDSTNAHDIYTISVQVMQSPMLNDIEGKNYLVAHAYKTSLMTELQKRLGNLKDQT
jgi:hypothetical protein